MEYCGVKPYFDVDRQFSEPEESLITGDSASVILDSYDEAIKKVLKESERNVPRARFIYVENPMLTE